LRVQNRLSCCPPENCSFSTEGWWTH